MSHSHKSESEITEVIGVDICGEYGHFRKPYATSSPVTHTIPPRTALTGLLGAIMGYPRTGDGNYHDMLAPSKAKISVVPRAELTTQRINKNMLRVKDDTEALVDGGKPPQEITRTQVPFEFLRNPHYTLYIAHTDNDVFTDIQTQLANHKSVYTPSLGLSELLAEFEYRGVFPVTQHSDSTSVDSVVNMETHTVGFDRGKQYTRENISIAMNPTREVLNYADIVYAEPTTTGNTDPSQNNEQGVAPVTINDSVYYTLDGAVDDRVTFLSG